MQFPDCTSFHPVYIADRDRNVGCAVRTVKLELVFVLVLVHTRHPVTESVSRGEQVISDQAESRFPMAQVTAHSRAFGYTDGLSAAFIIVVIFFITQVDAVSSRLRQHRAFKVTSVTGLAGTRVAFVEIFMLQVPRPAVDVMHAMGATEGQGKRGMAYAALADAA